MMTFQPRKIEKIGCKLNFVDLKIDQKLNEK